MLRELKEKVDELLRRIRAEGHVYWWIRPDVSALFEANGYYLVPHHHYAPLPDPSVIRATLHGVDKYPLEPLGFSKERCEETLTSLLPYWDEFKAFVTGSAAAPGFPLQNAFYSGMDAFVLYALVRERRPKRLVEVGSGFSTHVAHAAMEANGEGRITCIEPHPTPKLLELGSRVEVVRSSVQDAGVEPFAALERGDFCFIDSSHVSKLDSDVNFEVFRILPALRPGVVVHVHDIHLPYEYPQHWVKERRWFWNEQYLLYAYLLGAQGRTFRIELPVHWTIRNSSERLALTSDLPGFVLQGSGFWMTRRDEEGEPPRPLPPLVKYA